MFDINYTPTDRSGYLDWVYDWKKEYTSLSYIIRSQKSAIKNLSKGGEGQKHSIQQKQLNAHKKVAIAMISARKRAKVQAGEQRAITLQLTPRREL